MTEKQEVLIDVTDQFEKYNHMFVNVNLKVFKRRAVEILDNHLDKLEESLRTESHQKASK